MAWPEQLRIEIAGLGRTLFCHGSPRSDTEILTRDSSEQRVAEALAGVEETVVVCGHTHVQFDRRAAGHRIVNAGSVGMAYEGEPGVACWVLLGPDVELRRSRFDPYAAAQAMRDTGMPAVEEFVHATVLEPSTAADASREFENMATSRA
jgi:diadenosine tetraphosphatase ApaH/serine/threonine PP2A family protein phosphatase